VRNVNEDISKALKGYGVEDQKAVDEAMITLDGTENKSRLGANAILAVSLAVARAAAEAVKTPLYKYLAQKYGYDSAKSGLPTPFFNIFNGGKHADTNLDFQEFMIVPMSESNNTAKHGKNLFSEKVRIGSEIFHELGSVLKEAGMDTDIGNEGGYAPDIVSSIQAIEMIMAAVIRAGYKPGKDIVIGIDVGSSELYDAKTGKYIFKLDKSHFTSNNLVGLYYEWFRKYPIISIEDGVAEDDWSGWRELTEELGKDMLIVGDDLFVTNIKRFRAGLKERVANTVLIKPNQVGTLSETLDCIRLAQRHNYNIMVSHRSGETADDFISDLAVAVGAEFIKAGSLSRGERLAKYNRLMEIELELLDARSGMKVKKQQA